MKNTIIAISFIMYYALDMLLSFFKVKGTEISNCNTSQHIYGKINNIIPYILLLSLLRYSTKFVLYFMDKVHLDKSNYVNTSDNVLMYILVSMTTFVYMKSLTKNNYLSILVSIICASITTLIVDKSNIGNMKLDEALYSMNLCKDVVTNPHIIKPDFLIAYRTTKCYGILNEKTLYVIFSNSDMIKDYNDKYYSLPIKISYNGHTIPTGSESYVNNMKTKIQQGSTREFHKMRLDEIPFNIYKQMRQYILTKVSDEVYTKKVDKVIFTGFRYGGSIAQIASLDVSYKDIIIRTYSFGAPHLGNNKMINYQYEHVPNTYNIINNTDKIGYKFNKINSSSKTILVKGVQFKDHDILTYNDAIKNITTDATLKDIGYYVIMGCLFIALYVLSDTMYIDDIKSECIIKN